jgi:probable lipoprotein (TIGR04455 family)
VKRALVIALLAAGCSSVNDQWVRAGYGAGPDLLKRIAIVAWAPAEHARLAETLAMVATDRVKLKLNYLVYASGPMQRGWSDACADKVEGVLAIQTLAAGTNGKETGLALATELYSCKTGALLWRAEAADTADVDDADLVELTKSYVEKLGQEAAGYAAASFLVLRDMLDTLPNPTLTDDELMEKIELD